MMESVCKFIDLVGTSTESWERATRAAIGKAQQSLRDLRVAEVAQQDVNSRPSTHCPQPDGGARDAEVGTGSGGLIRL